MADVIDPALVASDLRVVLGQLVRRLREEHRLPLSHAAVLGRLDRQGPAGISELAVAERVRPQSIAQAIADLHEDGLVTRRPDPADGRRTIVELSPAGLARLEDERGRRQGWLAMAVAEELTPAEQAALHDVIPLLRRLAEL